MTAPDFPDQSESKIRKRRVHPFSESHAFIWPERKAIKIRKHRLMDLQNPSKKLKNYTVNLAKPASSLSRLALS